MQIINDKDITGVEGKVTYVNGVELLFKQIPEGQHASRLWALTQQINDLRNKDTKLSEHRAKLLKYIFDNKLLSVIECAEVLQVSRQRVYKIIESLSKTEEEE